MGFPKTSVKLQDISFPGFTGIVLILYLRLYADPSRSMFLERPVARAGGEKHLKGLEALVARLRGSHNRRSSEFCVDHELRQPRRGHVLGLLDARTIV